MSVDWGIWAGVGMSRNAAATLKARGDVPMSADRALAALERIFQWGGTQWVVTSQAMPHMLGLPPRRSLRAVGETSGEPLLSNRRLLGELVQALARQLSTIAGLDPQTLDPRRSFLEIGLDSMLAIRWVRDLESRTRQRLPATLPFDHPNLVDLATHLETLLDQDAIERLLIDAPQHLADNTLGASVDSAPTVENAEPDRRDGHDERQTADEAGDYSALCLSTGRRVTKVLRRNR